jgi:hypothetical protein
VRRTHHGQALSVLANASFVTVDSALLPHEALRSLGALRYAIVVGSEDPDARPDDTTAGQPVALCTAADLGRVGDGRSLARADLPPALVLPATLTIGELVASDAITLLDLSPHGAVVADGVEIVGVLETHVVDDHLATTASVPSESRTQITNLPSDSVLGGSVQSAVARVVCGHPGCRYVNRLTFYDPKHPPLCQNPAHDRHHVVIARR